jgi:amidase
VATGLSGTAPVGVQLIGDRYREDVLLAAGEAIEAAGVPPLPVNLSW